MALGLLGPFPIIAPPLESLSGHEMNGCNKQCKATKQAFPSPLTTQLHSPSHKHTCTCLCKKVLTTSQVPGRLLGIVVLSVRVFVCVSSCSYSHC